MNAKLNIDSLPSSHQLHDSLALSPSGNHLRRQSTQNSQTTAMRSNVRRKASSVGVSTMRNTANRSGQNGQQTEVMPIMFEGKEINTIHDLIANFKLDTYEEAAEKRKSMKEDPDNPLPGPKDID